MYLLKNFMVLCSMRIFFSTHGQLNSCRDTDLPSKCSCEPNLVTCVGLKELPPPEDFPVGTLEYIFVSLELETLPRIAYTNAEKLLFLEGDVNDITSGAFSDLRNLRVLQFVQHPIESIKADMFTGLHNLTELVLKGTGLKYFPHNISNEMPNLKKLDLSENKGINLDSKAFRHSNLEHLRMEGCGLFSPPILVEANFESLKILELAYNEIALLGDGSFWPYVGLTTLSMDKCGLANMHTNAFEGLAVLEILHLGGNELKSLPDRVFSPTSNITELNLKDNSLTTLEYDVVRDLDLEKLKSVDLSENPWKCDCSITWINDLSHDVPLEQNLTCASPEELEGQPILNVSRTLDCPCGYKGCSPTTTSNTIALAVGIPIILICVALIVFFIVMIVRSRQRGADEKNVRYSAVYRDTTENRTEQVPQIHPTKRPLSEL